MRERIENGGWIRSALAVRRPIQFHAFAWGSTIGLLAITTRNSSLTAGLGPVGLLLMMLMFAGILLAILTLHHRYCHRGRGGARAPSPLAGGEPGTVSGVARDDRGGGGTE